MVDLNWCKRQNGGIKLVEPNENLAREYLANAEETLMVLREIDGKSNMWVATMKYYFEYFLAYAVLMRIGVKCEIHDCTIEVCKRLENDDALPGGFYSALKKDKSLRIDNQYYLKNKKVDVDYGELSRFLLEIKNFVSRVSEDGVNKARSLI